MKSKLLVVTWLVVVFGLLALAVYTLLQDPETGDRGAGTTTTQREVPQEGEEEAGGRERSRVGRQPVPELDSKILGRVLDADGSPVAGAEVDVSLPVETSVPAETADLDDLRFINSVIYVDPEDWDQARPLNLWLATMRDRTSQKSGAERVAQGVTGDDGSFRMVVPRHVGIGPFRVVAHAGDARASAQGVRPGTEIELTLGPAAAVAGNVYSGDANVGVAGATVVLDDGEARFVGTTDQDGSFRIEGVSPGWYAVSAGAERHPPLLEERMEVRSGQELNVRLPRGAILRVSAVFEDEEGNDRPLPDAEIVVLEQDTYSYVRAVTDANGLAEIRGLPPGVYLINGRAQRAVSFGEEITELTGAQLLQDVELLFEPAVDTQLTVVDENGDPVEGMEFYTANADEEYDAVRSVKVDGRTDAQGRFTFAFEFEGPRALLFGFKPGFALVRAYPDAHDEGIPMRLVAHRGVRVHGTIRTPEGHAVPDAVVWIEVTPEGDEEEDDYVVQVRTRADGTYDFPFVPRGDIWVSAELGEDGWTDDYEVELVDGQDAYRVDMEMELE